MSIELDLVDFLQDIKPVFFFSHSSDTLIPFANSLHFKGQDSPLIFAAMRW